MLLAAVNGGGKLSFSSGARPSYDMQDGQTLMTRIPRKCLRKQKEKQNDRLNKLDDLYRPTKRIETI
jgi:hypothetical protein